jgi:hypothetical protein
VALDPSPQERNTKRRPGLDAKARERKESKEFMFADLELFGEVPEGIGGSAWELRRLSRRAGNKKRY